MAERLYPNATLFIEIAVFLIILFVLTRFLFKPILKILDERRKRIEGARQEAKRLGEEVKALLAVYETKIAEAKRESSRVAEDLKRQGDELAKEIVSKAKTESDRNFSESKEKIWKEAREIEKRLGSMAEEISEDLASKIIK